MPLGVDAQHAREITQLAAKNRVRTIGFDEYAEAGGLINLKTAKAPGLTIPQSALLRADRIIQ